MQRASGHLDGKRLLTACLLVFPLWSSAALTPDARVGINTKSIVIAQAAPPVARVLAGKRYLLPALNAATIDVLNQLPQQGAANPGTAAQ